MSFARPDLLWLLLLVPPALLLFLWWAGRVRRDLIKRFIPERLLPGLIAGRSPGRERFRTALLVSGMIFLILALAGPQWGYELQEMKQRGLDIVVAIDTSRSMLAEDIAPNRLTRAKYAALDLLLQARTDRMGLVAFAGTAFLQCPLTFDDAAFRQSVNSLDVHTLPQGGTALAAAIQTAATAFKEDANHKVLVLLTDGEDHDSAAVEAATEASKAGLRIFTIGIGSPQGELLRIRDARGQSDYVRDEQGNVVKSHLNENLLRQIAGAASGFYLPLQGTKVIDTLYEKGLAPLPKSESQEKWVRHPKERFHWPLAIAIALLAWEALFPERKRPGLRHAPKASSLAGTAMILAITLMLPSISAQGSVASAQRSFESGRFDESLKEYERLLQGNTNDVRLHFNAGVAAYRAGEFESAAQHFEPVTAAPDLQLQQRAYYNLGNTLFRLGERQADPTQKKSLWQDAIGRFEGSLKLNPEDPDAKFNLEFVRRKLQELEQQQSSQSDSKPPEPSEEAKRAKAAADEAVRRRDYSGALSIMEKQLAKDPSTAHYSDYIQRLKEINGVKTTAHP